MYQIMTAGPTQVRENVRLARALACTNPDLDPQFFDEYREICGMLSKALCTENEALILGGEGILSLEAACASLTEPGDRVLVIDNGVFGKGFAGFVRIYGGDPVSFVSDYHRPVDIDALEAFLKKDSAFKYATVVHCDTPSGVLNDVNAISRLLDSYGIMTVADSVAGAFGEKLDLSQGKIDILCGGSQKALSCPPGLSMLWISERAWLAMENRKTPIAAFYANLLTFRHYYEEQAFPYTMPISDITAMKVALENFFADPDVYDRHTRIAKAARAALTECGTKLYLESGWASTVTAIRVPEGVTDMQILRTMEKDYNIMISGCFDVLAGKVVRLGHMGENARPDKVAAALRAFQGSLEKLGVPTTGDMGKVFYEHLA